MTEQKYPITCILRGHRWKPRAFWPGYVRSRSCRRCEHITPHDRGAVVVTRDD